MTHLSPTEYLDKAHALLKQAEGGMSIISSTGARSEFVRQLADSYTELARVTLKVESYEAWKTDS